MTSKWEPWGISLLLSKYVNNARAYPNILWQPAKTNEGMNPLKEYSSEKFAVNWVINLGIGKGIEGKIAKSLLLIFRFLITEIERITSWIGAWKLTIREWRILSQAKGRRVRMMKKL